MFAMISTETVTPQVASAQSIPSESSLSPTAQQSDRTFSSAAKDGIPAWHAGFLSILPAITAQVRYAFRRLRKEAREEAVQEAICNAMLAYARLIERGKQDVAAAGPLARFAIRQTWEGRRVGGKLSVRDVMSTYCQRRKHVTVERLDRWDEEENAWEEILIQDRTCTPAALAAARIDFAAWLASLSSRDRKIAKLLAGGSGTSEVAEKFAVSPSRVSQLRRELRQSWERFHAPRTVDDAGDEVCVAA